MINNQNKSIHSLGARNVKNRNEQIAIATLSLQILFFTLDLHFKLKRLTKTETETQNRTEKRALKTETQLKPRSKPKPRLRLSLPGGEKIRNFQPAGMKTARRIGRHCQAAVEIVAWIWGMCGTSNSHGTIRKKSQTESHHLSTIDLGVRTWLCDKEINGRDDFAGEMSIPVHLHLVHTEKF